MEVTGFAQWLERRKCWGGRSLSKSEHRAGDSDPAPLVVQGDEEQIGEFEVLQGLAGRRGTSIRTSHGV